MSRKRNATAKAGRKIRAAQAPQLGRQRFIPLGLVAPLSDIEIGRLVTILSPESAPDGHRLTLLSNNLYRATDNFVWDIILKVQGYPEKNREFLEGVVSNPLLTLADIERSPNMADAARTLLMSVALINHKDRKGDEIASAARLDEFATAAKLIVVAQKAAKVHLLTFRGRDKREDYALRSFLAVVIYIAGEFNCKLDLPQHSDRGGSRNTTSLFAFAEAALILAADRGLAVAADGRMLSTERMLTDAEADKALECFRAYAKKPTGSRSAFIKNLEAARRAAASVHKNA